MKIYAQVSLMSEEGAEKSCLSSLFLPLRNICGGVRFGTLSSSQNIDLIFVLTAEASPDRSISLM